MSFKVPHDANVSEAGALNSIFLEVLRSLHMNSCQKEMIEISTKSIFYVHKIRQLRGASCFKVFPCSLSSCFVIPFSIVITSLGEEGGDLCVSRAFDCIVVFCHFSLPLGVGGFAAVSGCGTHWTFLLTFLHIYVTKSMYCRFCV